MQRFNIDSDNFEPRADFILVRGEQATENVTAAGVIIPLSNTPGTNGRDTAGTVVKIGVDVVGIAISDYVLWPETDGLDLEFADGEFVLLRMKSIIGKRG